MSFTVEDEQNGQIRVVVTVVGNNKQAQSLSDSINNKNISCEIGVLCEAINVFVEGTQPSISTRAACASTFVAVFVVWCVLGVC